jgi:hypothetical protein
MRYASERRGDVVDVLIRPETIELNDVAQPGQNQLFGNIELVTFRGESIDLEISTCVQLGV